MKIQLIKNDIVPIQSSSQYAVERLLAEGQELEKVWIFRLILIFYL